MHLRQIEAFKAVMETGTVTLAGERLLISQPAVSKLLQAFERSAGMTLFAREGGRLHPTAEARLLYQEVDRIFQGADRIRQAADEIRTRHRGSLAVGVMPALSVGFVQDILAQLGTPPSGVQVSIQSSDTPRLLEQLVTHQIELFYTARPIDHPEVRCETLCRLPLVCILPPGHRLVRLREIRCRDLVGEPFAALRLESGIRRAVDGAFHRAHVAPRIALEAPMGPTVCAFVARGLGVSVVDPLYVGAFSCALAVRPFRPVCRSEIFLITPRSRRLSTLAQSFVEASRAWVQAIEQAG